MMRQHGCDYCQQTNSNQDGDILHVIPLTRKLNGDRLEAELCTTCLGQIAAFVMAKVRAMQLDGSDGRFIRQHLSNCRTREGGRCDQDCVTRIDPKTGREVGE